MMSFGLSQKQPENLVSAMLQEFCKNVEWKNAALSVPTLHIYHVTQSADYRFLDSPFSCSQRFFLNSMMSILLQEYTLAHIDKPDTLAGAEKALKKHEDFVSTMEANEDKIDGALQGGQRLVDSNNLYSPKVQEKMDSVQDRLCFVFV